MYWKLNSERKKRTDTTGTSRIGYVQHVQVFNATFLPVYHRRWVSVSFLLHHSSPKEFKYIIIIIFSYRLQDTLGFSLFLRGRS